MNLESPPPWKDHRICVLLIDDQAIIAEAVRRLVCDQPDIDFHYCHEPSKALGKANEVSPTVILLDMVMPEIDGMTLLKFIKGSRKLRETPVIILSGNDDKKTKAEAFAAGASDYAVKIPEKAELLGRIRAHSKYSITLRQRDETAAALRAILNPNDQTK
jgi:PleD family two-component response regulator